jgi:anti-sigma regulatory factor (Ser/Thr protein kinase)
MRSAECFTAVDLRLPATPSQLKRARDCVAEVAADFGFSRRAGFDLVFAVNEAVTNAIKHGSPDVDGTVGLTVDVDGDSLVCTVQDCGPFIPRATTDNQAESGRGFAFMEAMTDAFELIVEPGSTVVRLRKSRCAGTPVVDA